MKPSQIDNYLNNLNIGKKEYSWNPAYNYIMKIKKDYMLRFGDIDTYNIKEMIKRLDIEEYNTFINNVNVSIYGPLNLFKYVLYNMDKTDMGTNVNSIYREMRSLVIDLKEDNIVLCPFKKFFNIGELEETKMDKVSERVKTAKLIEITNKMDGSMQSGRYYNGKYIMSGSQAIDPTHSDRLMEGYSWLDDRYKRMLRTYSEYSFVFEYISQNDLHVVRYKPEEQGLYLTGMRNVFTGEELPYRDIKKVAKEFDVPMTMIENKTFDEITNETQGVHKGNEKEGWVLNIDGQKYKLKTNDFLGFQKIFHKLVTPNNILEYIKNGSYDDLISKLPPEYLGDVRKYADNIYTYVRMINEEAHDLFDRIMDNEDINSKRDFAIKVNTVVPKEYRGYLFSLYDGKELDVLKGLDYSDILDWLDNNKWKIEHYTKGM